MKTLLVSNLLLGSLAMSCQSSDLAQTPQASKPSPAANSSNSSELATSKSDKSSSKSKTITAAQNKQVAATSQNPVSTQRSCRISAYVIDNDPNGLNVRSGPSSSDEIIGKLPTTSVAVFVDLTASQRSGYS